MSVALVIQHATHMCPIIHLSEACLAQPYFPTLSHKRHDSRGENFIEQETCVLILSTSFVCIISHSTEFSDKWVNQPRYRPGVATSAPYNLNWMVFITEMKSIYSAVRTGSSNKAVCASSLKCWNKAVCASSLKSTGHVIQQQFNIQQLYALPTLYLCVLYLSENKQLLVPLTA